MQFNLSLVTNRKFSKLYGLLTDVYLTFILVMLKQEIHFFLR